jgi:polyhydroxyalkanoate synthesis regulator phasin
MADKRQSRGDAVRQAVDEAFQAAAGQAQFTRERAQEIVDELTGAAGRLRDALDDLRPPTGDDVRELREEVRALAARVAALEEAQSAKRARAPRTTRAKSG